jgi:hypothetical protein
MNGNKHTIVRSESEQLNQYMLEYEPEKWEKTRQKWITCGFVSFEVQQIVLPKIICQNRLI